MGFHFIKIYDGDLDDTISYLNYKGKLLNLVSLITCDLIEKLINKCMQDLNGKELGLTIDFLFLLIVQSNCLILSVYTLNLLHNRKKKICISSDFICQ